MDSGEEPARSLKMFGGMDMLEMAYREGSLCAVARFLAGLSVGLALACLLLAMDISFAAILGLGCVFALSSLVCLLCSNWRRGGGNGEVSGGLGKGKADGSSSGTSHPRAASTAHAPRDFNPRQAAVDKLARRYLLTSREKEVLEFLARGNDVRFISESLVLSTNTVRTHVYNIYNKLGVHSKQEVLGEVEKMCDLCLLDLQRDVECGVDKADGRAGRAESGSASS